LSFFNELKRRNVFKVAIAHIVMADPAEGSDAVKTKGRYMNVARNMVGIWLYMADHACMLFLAPED
jgi:hypothetical protein